MPDFTTSQLSVDGNPVYKQKQRDSDVRNNTLVVVVTKAHGLRNVLKLDKQSPFVTIRIQDQEESTKVVARGGQTPTFNDELWFNLDNIEERTLYINAYHQKKNDAKLICSGEVDFSTALKRSTTEGYDGWFDLYYEGREAGRIYLEMTYYPRKGEVPIGTESAARLQMSKSNSKIPLSALQHHNNGGNSLSFNNTLREKNKQYKISDAENMPELGELKIDESTTNSVGRINNKFSQFEKRFNSSASRSPSHSPVKSELSKSSMEMFNDNLSDSAATSINELENNQNNHDTFIKDDNNNNANNNTNNNNNWLSFLDNTIKFPSILNSIPFNNKHHNNNEKDRKLDLNDELDSRVKLKVESPTLFQERPKKLFDSDIDDDEEEEGDDEDNDYNNNKDDSNKRKNGGNNDIYLSNNMRNLSHNVTDKWKKSIASRQEPIYGEVGLTVSSLPFKKTDIKRDDDDDDDDSEDEYTIGQIVDFKSSVKSNKNINPSGKRKLPNLKLDVDEMRQSYQGKSLPPIKQRPESIPTLDNSSDSSSELDMDDLEEIPPPPPKHIISMSSLFDNSVSTVGPKEKFVLPKSNSELPQTAPITQTLKEESNKNLSWYERRKLERRRRNGNFV